MALSMHKHLMMKAVCYVATGEGWATGRKIILRSDGIGSCVVTMAYDRQRRIGALAHILLPGRSARGEVFNQKYAGDAVQVLLSRMLRLGADAAGLEACLVGGANVLNYPADTLCEAIAASVSESLARERVRIVARACGGTLNRCAALDIETGTVWYREAAGEEKILHIWGDIHG